MTLYELYTLRERRRRKLIQYFYYEGRLIFDKPVHRHINIY